MVKSLLCAGAERDLKDNDGVTPLDLARRAAWPEVVECLQTATSHTQLTL